MSNSSYWYVYAAGCTALLLLASFLGMLAFPDGGVAAVRALELSATALGLLMIGLGMFLVHRLDAVASVRQFNLQQMLEEIQKLTSVIDTDFDGIVLTDTSGIIRHANPKWCAITGWSAEEVEGKMTPAILKSGFHQAHFYTNLWLTIQNGKRFHGELINKRKDGGYYKVEEVVLPIKNIMGKITGYAAFHHVLDPDFKPLPPEQLRAKA